MMKRSLLALLAGLALPALAATGPAPLLIGLDAEFGDPTSTSAKAIKLGIELAISDINRQGGVLHGRPLQLVVRDNRSVPARGADNVREFAAMPNMMAFFCGKFSPVTLEEVPIANRSRLLLLNPWSAADGIVNNGAQPNYVFRVGLNDSAALAAMLNEANRRKLYKLTLLLPNSAWGRSSLAAAEQLVHKWPKLTLLKAEWYDWGEEQALEKKLDDTVATQTQAIFLIANEPDGAHIVKEMARLPSQKRIPIISHWGITGGDFQSMTGESLRKVDLSVIQTFSFAQPRNALAASVARRVTARYKVDYPDQVPSIIGLAHAYDLTRMLALAIDNANSTDRAKVREQLEQLPSYSGIIKDYKKPFAHGHEAIRAEELFFSRFASNKRLLPLSDKRP